MFLIHWLSFYKNKVRKVDFAKRSLLFNKNYEAQKTITTLFITSDSKSRTNLLLFYINIKVAENQR